MKLTVTPPHDGKFHNYCLKCQSDTIVRGEKDGQAIFTCNTCGYSADRSLFFDKRVYWVADDGELWHESMIVFVRNRAGKFLFFDRTIYPFGLTAPAGHVDEGEEPAQTTVRELEEEVGIVSQDLRYVATDYVTTDSCSSGADSHRVHIYVEAYEGDDNITVREEGGDPIWLTIDEALPKDKTALSAYVLEHYATDLQKV